MLSLVQRTLTQAVGPSEELREQQHHPWACPVLSAQSTTPLAFSWGPSPRVCPTWVRALNNGQTRTVIRAPHISQHAQFTRHLREEETKAREVNWQAEMTLLHTGTVPSPGPVVLDDWGSIWLGLVYWPVNTSCFFSTSILCFTWLCFKETFSSLMLSKLLASIEHSVPL